MVITLTKQDAHQSRLMGADTVKLCEMQGFPPRLENKKQTRAEANACGFMAEFAIARLFDLDPPTVNVLTDGGVDLWCGETSIDVKYTNKERGPLIFDTPEKFKSDIAILVGMVGGWDPAKENESVRINGWIDRKTFLEKAVRHDFGYGPRLKMDAEDIFPIEKLWYYFQMNRFKKKT